jgi:hypothetical protein
MNDINWWGLICLLAILSTGGALAILVHNYRRGWRPPANKPAHGVRLRISDRQPVPRLTREVEREFQHRVYTHGISAALEWLADLWNVEVPR